MPLVVEWSLCKAGACGQSCHGCHSKPARRFMLRYATLLSAGKTPYRVTWSRTPAESLRWVTWHTVASSRAHYTRRDFLSISIIKALEHRTHAFKLMASAMHNQCEEVGIKFIRVLILAAMATELVARNESRAHSRSSRRKTR